MTSKNWYRDFSFRIGKLIAFSALFFLVVGESDRQNFLFLLPCLLIAIKPNQASLVISVCSPFFFVHYVSVFVLKKEVLSPSIFIFLGAFSAYLFFTLLLKARKILSEYSPFILGVFIVSLGILLSRYFPKNSFLVSFFVASSLGFWFFCYSWRLIGNSISPPSWHEIFLSLFPFWSRFSLPVPGALSENSLKSNSFSETQNSSLRLMLFCVVPLALLLKFAIALSPNSPVFSIAVNIGFEDSSALYPMEHFLGAPKLWVAMLLGYILFIIKHTIDVGLVVGLARICGVPLFRPVYKPYAARSFYDFLSRTSYYYVLFIVDIFISPISAFFMKRGIKRSTANSLAIFLGLFLGGMAFQIMIFPFGVLSGGFTFLLHSFFEGYYYFLVALIVLVSIAAQSSGAHRLNIFRPFYLIWYCVAHGLLIFAIGHSQHKGIEPSVVIPVLLRMFGIG